MCVWEGEKDITDWERSSGEKEHRVKSYLERRMGNGKRRRECVHVCVINDERQGQKLSLCGNDKQTNNRIKNKQLSISILSSLGFHAFSCADLIMSSTYPGISPTGSLTAFQHFGTTPQLNVIEGMQECRKWGQKQMRGGKVRCPWLKMMIITKGVVTVVMVLLLWCWWCCGNNPVTLVMVLLLRS